MAAYLKLEHTLCPRCGTTESDWVNPATKLPHDTPKWEATTFRCFGCAELARAEMEVPEREPGVRVVLVPWDDDDEDDPDED